MSSISSSTNQHDVQALRKTLRHKRKNLGSFQKKRAGLKLARQLSRCPIFIKSQHIAFYHANNGELDLHLLIELAWKKGKFCYLPLVKKNSRQLLFSRYKRKQKLQKKAFGIYEPLNGKNIPTAKLDLVLMPLLGFDVKGNRLGMGGGYYDYSFRRKNLFRFTKPKLIAVAYRCQKIACVDNQPWDIKPDNIVAI